MTTEKFVSIADDGTRTESQFVYTSNSETDVITISLYNTALDVLPPYPASNVASCSSNLGTINYLDTGEAAFGGEIYLAQLRLTAGDLPSDGHVQVRISCNKPIRYITGGPGGATQGTNTIQGEPFYFDPILFTHAQFTVQPPSDYELKQEVIDLKTLERVDGNGPPVVMPPSIARVAGCTAEEFNVPKQIHLTCINKITNLPATDSDPCRVFYTKSLGARSGGHLHDDPRRPLGDSNPQPSATVPLLVGSQGADIGYFAPEVSGNVEFTFTATGPGGASVSTTPLTLDIRQFYGGYPVEMIDLTLPGLEFVNIVGHEGTFGTVGMRLSLLAVVGLFSSYVRSEPMLRDLPPLTLQSEGASLITGGLFDYNFDGRARPTPWSPPHCGHRNGQQLDLRMSTIENLNLTPTQKRVYKIYLQLALENYFEAPNRSESPIDPSSNHWHIQ